MRIGIDAHIILPQHKRYDPKIARFTENLITHLIEADKKQEHTWVLFFDERMQDKKLLQKFSKKNVIIKRFPFVQYRRYLPVLYSHMLISSFLRSARLDVFHSPEGLIPFVYPGRMITTFHYVPRGKLESGLFVRTFMLGARVAFAQLCKRARRIIVFKANDKKLLVERHGYPAERVVVIETEDIERVDWAGRVKELLALYEDVVTEKKKRRVKKAKPKSKKKVRTKKKKPAKKPKKKKTKK
ncbi:hypothetical protein CL628_03940 [bacterium]|nr:hypothetical protein [bacterium]